MVGHPAAPPYAMEFAAVLACAPRAALSHTSAAAVFGLLPYPAHTGPQHVTVIGRNPGPKPGIRIHRVRSCDEQDLTTVRRIPMTSAARTLVDIASAVPANQLEQAVAEAMARRLVTTTHLFTALDRNRHRPGAARLRAVLEQEERPALTRSQAERRLLDLVRQAGLPPPELNARVGGFEVDFVWRREKLVVEVDGFQYHSSRLGVRTRSHSRRGTRVPRISGDPGDVEATRAAARCRDQASRPRPPG